MAGARSQGGEGPTRVAGGIGEYGLEQGGEDGRIDREDLEDD